MDGIDFKRKNLKKNILILIILIAFAAWIKHFELQNTWQQAGIMNFSIGFVLLAAYSVASILKMVKLPLISGYIFTGIAVGPYVLGFLDTEMVHKFRLIDDLALSFIAMTAGGALHLRILNQHRKSLFLNIFLLILIVFFFVFLFVVITGPRFRILSILSGRYILALALLLGIVAIARSPSSAIAVISECRASGRFTELVLGVVIVMDVLIIVLFTIAISFARMILAGSSEIAYLNYLVLFCTIGASLFIGGGLGKTIAAYIKHVGHDLTLFLLFIAFGISKSCMIFNTFMETQFQIQFNLEPLLVCISAGFIVQNFSTSGEKFVSTLEQISLPIFVFFFFVSGASLNLDALRLCWPLALGLVIVRILGIFAATWLAGILSQDPPIYRRYAWMAYLTQTGVALGLSQMAQRQFPEIGTLLATVVLAVITLNQIIGPIAFKSVLNLTGEARNI